MISNPTPTHQPVEIPKLTCDPVTCLRVMWKPKRGLETALLFIRFSKYVGLPEVEIAPNAMPEQVSSHRREPGREKRRRTEDTRVGIAEKVFRLLVDCAKVLPDDGRSCDIDILLSQDTRYRTRSVLDTERVASGAISGRIAGIELLTLAVATLDRKLDHQ